MAVATHHTQTMMVTTNDNDNDAPNVSITQTTAPVLGASSFFFLFLLSFAWWALPPFGVSFSFFFCLTSAGPHFEGHSFIFPFSSFCLMSTAPIWGFLFFFLFLLLEKHCPHLGVCFLFFFLSLNKCWPPFWGPICFSFSFLSTSAGPSFWGPVSFSFSFHQQVLAPILGASSFFISSMSAGLRFGGQWSVFSFSFSFAQWTLPPFEGLFLFLFFLLLDKHCPHLGVSFSFPFNHLVSTPSFNNYHI